MISITQDLKFKQAVVEYSFKHTSRRIRLYKLLLTGKVKWGNIKLTICFTSNILFGVNDKIISTYE